MVSLSALTFYKFSEMVHLMPHVICTHNHALVLIFFCVCQSKWMHTTFFPFNFFFHSKRLLSHFFKLSIYIHFLNTYSDAMAIYNITHCLNYAILIFNFNRLQHAITNRLHHLHHFASAWRKKKHPKTDPYCKRCLCVCFYPGSPLHKYYQCNGN